MGEPTNCIIIPAASSRCIRKRLTEMHKVRKSLLWNGAHMYHQWLPHGLFNGPCKLLLVGWVISCQTIYVYDLWFSCFFWPQNHISMLVKLFSSFHLSLGSFKNASPIWPNYNWLVVSTQLKSIRQNWNLPQVGRKITGYLKLPPKYYFTNLDFLWNKGSHFPFKKLFFGGPGRVTSRANLTRSMVAVQVAWKNCKANFQCWTRAEALIAAV